MDTDRTCLTDMYREGYPSLLKHSAQPVKHNLARECAYGRPHDVTGMQSSACVYVMV